MNPAQGAGGVMLQRRPVCFLTPSKSFLFAGVDGISVWPAINCKSHIEGKKLIIRKKRNKEEKNRVYKKNNHQLNEKIGFRYF